MAKKDDSPKIVTERTYNVPLRRRWLHVPKYKRAKKAITTLKVFLIKHMKPEKDEKGRLLLKLGKHLNDHIWHHGMKNPPHHIKIITKKDEKGLVTAELEGAPVEEAKEEKKASKKEKKEETKGAQEKAVEENKEKVRKEEKTEIEEAKEEKKEAKELKPKVEDEKASEEHPTAPMHR